MDAVNIESRQQRGLMLVKAKGKRIKEIVDGKLYLVPSQGESVSSGYVVDTASKTCSCPDFETTGTTCKHQWAVAFFTHEIAMPDGTTVVTQTLRISYPQNWVAYNAAQCEEKDRVRILLRGLCDGVAPLPYKGTGRRPIPLSDVLYAATMKVYGTMSGRRSTSDLRDCEESGLVEHAAHYNTTFRYVERADVTPILGGLVEASAAPLRAVESDFAADATGFCSPSYVRWFDHRHGQDRRVQKWVKCHAMVGVKTHIITAVDVTSGHVNDAPMLPGLIKRTVDAGFHAKQISADKGYLSRANIDAITAVGAEPFVPMKVNSTSSGSIAWQRLYHLFALNRDVFLASYHKRSNSETVFSSVKRKFGENVRSKTETAQFNEVLLKCLCHNLSMLVHAIHEFNVDPKFWLPVSK